MLKAYSFFGIAVIVDELGCIKLSDNLFRLELDFFLPNDAIDIGLGFYKLDF